MIENTFYNTDYNTLLDEIKNGIYSIVSAGITQGLESIDCQDADIAVFLENAKHAASTKGKEVFQNTVDQFQEGVYSAIDNKITDIEDAITNKTEDISNSITEKAENFSDNIIDGIRDKVIDKAKIKDTDTVNFFAENTKQVIHGDITFSDFSHNAIDKTVDIACDKLGISTYLDPAELKETAKNAKTHFIDLLNGDINSTEFFMKTAENGLYQAATEWGSSVGRYIVRSAKMRGMAASLANAASSTIITAVYSEMFNYVLSVYQEERASEQRLNIIKALHDQAVSVILSERESLLKSTFISSQKQQKVFNESLKSIATALNTNDAELLSSALNKITAEVGGTIQFRNFEEFDDFMKDDSLIFEF